jgi:hypothetical protein
MRNFKIILCGLLVLGASHLLNVNVAYGQDGPALSEGELREDYYGADRKIMQCANGSSECSAERVEDLKAARDAAQNGLTIHYNYKYVDGVYIKDPGN